MKRFMALLAAGALLVGMTGCGGSPSASEEPSEVPTEEAAAEAVENPTQVATEEPTQVATAPADADAMKSVKEQLNTGDYESALTTAKDAGFDDLAASVEKLIEVEQSECFVEVESFSKNKQVYGDEATVIDGTTNAIPFVNATGNYVHLQLGFVEKFVSSHFYGGWPTTVELATSDEHWSWEVDYDQSVSDMSDESRTWVFETELTDETLPLLASVGASEPGEAMVRFSDPAAGKMDYTLTEAEISAFAHVGAFVEALQNVQAAYTALKG